MRVLLAVDGSDASDDVAAAAANLFQETDEFQLLTVIEPRQVHETYGSDTPPGGERLIATGGEFGTVLMHQPGGGDPVEGVAQASIRVESEYRRALEALAERQLPPPRHWTAHVVIDDHPADAILAFAAEIGAHGIAMGTRGRGQIASALLGSVAEDVIRRSPIPVVIVRQGMRVPERDVA